MIIDSNSTIKQDYYLSTDKYGVFYSLYVYTNSQQKKPTN